MFHDIENALAHVGLLMRGTFTPNADDGLSDDINTVVMVGNAGPDMWQAFSQSEDDQVDTLDHWTRTVIDPIARTFNAKALYPFDGPPYYPFQQWAMRADTVYPSPIGPLIHPTFGLWHAYRAALLFETALAMPNRAQIVSPCKSCLDRPCLDTCPVGAFTTDAYDVPSCRAHIGSQDGADCLSHGCQARRACPVGRDYIYELDQATFHMTHFLNA